MSKKNTDEEIQNENQKKGNFIPVLVVLLLIIAILMIVTSLGFGGGLGSGNGDGASVNSGVSENSLSDNSGTENTHISETESETETVPEETTESIKYIDVTVSGDTYLMNNTEKTLEAFISLAKDGDNTVVRITDDNAVADAMDSLISALDENSISYIEPNAE